MRNKNFLILSSFSCQKALGADYTFGIKGNQGTLEAEVCNYFTQAQAIEYEDDSFKSHITVEKGHGRIETRHICVSHDLEWLEQKDEWKLESLIEIRSERIIGDRVEKGVLYYGSS
jgi:predicted transposase YbfD/YdcC